MDPAHVVFVHEVGHTGLARAFADALQVLVGRIAQEQTNLR